jgi:hypothetical protein
MFQLSLINNVSIYVSHLILNVFNSCFARVSELPRNFHPSYQIPSISYWRFALLKDDRSVRHINILHVNVLLELTFQYFDTASFNKF